MIRCVYGPRGLNRYRKSKIYPMDADRTKIPLLRALRLAPIYLRCDYPAFVRHVYLSGLGRDPEPGVAMSPLDSPEDVYETRVRYIGSVLVSEEIQLRGYDAMVNAVPDMLGCSDRQRVAQMVQRVFPTTPALIAGIGMLMNHVSENSRRQDLLLATVASAGTRY